MLGKTTNTKGRAIIALVLNALAFLLAAGVLLTGCRQKSAFDGSRTSDESGFWMEYTILDREESANLPLSEGDQLQVIISHIAGNVDLTVEPNPCSAPIPCTSAAECILYCLGE